MTERNYVLDTNIISALRRPEINPDVVEWIAEIPLENLFTTAFNLFEIEHGVVKKEREDARQGAVLRAWFEDQVLTTFASRILEFDHAAARILAQFPVPERAPLEDALIAAIAVANGMVVVTKNMRHFEPLGIEVQGF